MYFIVYVHFCVCIKDILYEKMQEITYYYVYHIRDFGNNSFGH